MKVSFYKRVVLLLCGLVLLVQLFNLSAVLTTISEGVRSEMRTDLQKASELVVQLLEQRSNLLLTSTEVLAADFGFRAALASQDDATILSALRNNVDRIDADLATFVALDNRILGTSYSASSQPDKSDLDAYLALAADSEHTGRALATLVLDGYAYEVVSVPVKAPLTVGWLVVGFALNDSIAKAFSNKADMHVTFAAGSAPYTFYGSSFNKSLAIKLPSAMNATQQTGSGLVTTLEQEDFLTRSVKLASEKGGVISLVHVSLDAALANYRVVRNRLLMYTAISQCIAIALGLWFARSVTNPVRLLSNAARRIREGDYQTNLENSLGAQRNDEIGDLIKTFDEMQIGIAKREAQISRHAYYDDLTQLPNRKKAKNYLHELIQKHSTDQKSIHVVLLNLNQYKQTAESLGHTVAEELALALSKRLRLTHERSSLIARISNDEFLILLTNCDHNDCQSIIEETISTLESPVVLSDAVLTPNISAGFASVPEHADNARDAIRRASIALADTRDAKHPIGCYLKGREESHLKQLSIVADLKRAVEFDELTLHFQPKISMHDEKVRSVEALVRWMHPEHGFMPPDEFIKLAENSGNIGLLTQWVLDAVIRQLRIWADAGIDLKAAVNLSAMDLNDDTLFSRIQLLLDTHNVPTSRLIIEVTESSMIHDAEKALQVLERMRKSGLTISIDDFGTGYSSLAKLKDLPIDELKIDRAFVSDIKSGETKTMIIKAIIDLGHSMNLTVISEGVETQEEWDLLHAMGNDVVQGYLISRPLDANNFTKWWHEHYPPDERSAA